MSNNQNFNYSKSIGNIGEKQEFVTPVLQKCSKSCFRLKTLLQCPRACETQIEHTGEQDKAVDVDYVLSRNCAGCPVFVEKLDANEEPVAKQTHEIKTEPLTCDKSTSSSAERTHNICIELVSNSRKYNEGKWEHRTNPKTGESYWYIGGEGWYGKNRPKADWYHFYQPIDAYLRAGMPHTPYYRRLKENDRIINEWLNDNSIPDNSILMAMHPVDIYISIKGFKLDELINELLNGGKLQEKDIRDNNGNIKRVYILPVSTLIPCDIGRYEFRNPEEVLCTEAAKEAFDRICRPRGIRRVQYPRILETKGTEGATISLTGEYITRDIEISLTGEYITRDGKRVRGILPEGKRAYIPESFYGRRICQHEDGRDYEALEAIRTKNYEGWRGDINIPLAVKYFIQGTEIYQGKVN